MATIEFFIRENDIKTFHVDVLALKYAQNFYGADQSIALLLLQKGVGLTDLQAQVDEYRYVETQDCIEAHHVLFVGVPPLKDFGYSDIRTLSQRTLAILAKEAPYTQHIGMTIHGSGFGLDENEALLAQFAGYIDALQTGQFPQNLKKISILSKNPEQVQRLRQIMEKNLSNAAFASLHSHPWSYSLNISTLANSDKNRAIESTQKFENAGQRFITKPHVFVAMPFKQEMYDVFYYGIQQPVHKAGFLCERIDEQTFIGDILDQMKKKIETASLVIAELSGGNPNVYLEVGYAWGKERPTVLLAKEGQELFFDIRGQKCLKYNLIKELEEMLEKELKELQSQNII